MSDFVALFTGQGSQFPGMGRELYDGSAAARRVLDAAEAALPGLRRLCFDGPAGELARTENTQPCVLAVDVAAYRAWGRTPVAAAGHSLGEYAALVAAGSLGLAAALDLVRARGRAMQEAVPEGEGGMVALLGPAVEEVRAAAAACAGVCDVANLNSPGQTVVAGETAAIDELCGRFGRRAVRLRVSVPFHSSLLAGAGRTFARRLDEAVFADPAFPIVCNADARPVTTAAEVRDALDRQFAGTVLWQSSVEWLLDEGRRHFVEFGPKATLRKMVEQTAQARGIRVETRVVSGAADLDG